MTPSYFWVQTCLPGDGNPGASPKDITLSRRQGDADRCHGQAISRRAIPSASFGLQITKWLSLGSCCAARHDREAFRSLIVHKAGVLLSSSPFAKATIAARASDVAQGACLLCGGWRRWRPRWPRWRRLRWLWWQHGGNPSPLVAAPAAASDLTILPLGASSVGLERAFL